jgi:hypothetical protein
MQFHNRFKLFQKQLKFDSDIDVIDIRVIGRSLNKKSYFSDQPDTHLTLRISSLWGLRWKKWYISGTRWRFWVLRPVLETLLNSIRTFFTKILVPV